MRELSVSSPLTRFAKVTGWQVLQPAIYLISLVPVLWLMSTVESYATLWPLCLAGMGVTLLQHAVNVFNDENDWRRGADSEKALSWVRYHRFNLARVRLHGLVSFAAGLVMGTMALHLAERVWVLAFAIVPVALGLWYNFGRHPLAYSRWGETVTGFCYGVGVFGCLWLLRPASFETLVLGIVGCGSLAMAVLLAHQPSQVLTDAAAGKQTFAVAFGAAKARRRSRLFYLLSVVTLAFTLWLAPLPLVPKLIAVVLTLVVGHVSQRQLSPGNLLLGTTLTLLFAQTLRLAHAGGLL